jgi:hypothetical protein
MSGITAETREVRTLAIQTVVETHRGLGIAERELKLGQFTAARGTIRQATAMCELLDQLVPQIGRPTILDGDPAAIEAALDALPLESVITYGSGIDFTAAIHVRAVSFVGTVWYETAFSKPTDSEAISRNGLVTVIA